MQDHTQFIQRLISIWLPVCILQVWKFPSSVIFIIDLFVLSSNTVALTGVTNFLSHAFPLKTWWSVSERLGCSLKCFELLKAFYKLKRCLDVYYFIFLLWVFGLTWYPIEFWPRAQLGFSYLTTKSTFCYYLDVKFKSVLLCLKRSDYWWNTEDTYFNKHSSFSSGATSNKTSLHEKTPLRTLIVTLGFNNTF